MTRWFPLLLMVGCNGDSTPAKSETGQAHVSVRDTGPDGSSPDNGTGLPDSGMDSSSPVDSASGCVGPNAVSLGPETCVQQAACQWTGSQYYGGLGYAVDVGGDIDGDGRPDMVAGAYLEDLMDGDSIALVDAGRVHIWLGATLDEQMAPIAAISGASAGSQLGYSVAIIPDINGDGFDEVLAGGRGASSEAELAVGEVQLILGSDGDWENPSVAVTWLGSDAYDRMGSTVAGTGDLNGDGLGEIAFTTDNRRLSSAGRETYGTGAVLILDGQPVITDLASPSEPDGRINGVGLSDSAGQSIATGDINGDGHTDLAIGAPYGRSGYGRVAVFLGSTDGFSGTKSIDDASIDLVGSEYGSTFGYSVAIGDLDADGHAELAIGSPLASERFSKGGAVYTYSGDAAFFDASPDPNTVLSGEFDDHQFGIRVTAGADLNGDGNGDMTVGAIYAWRGLVTKGGRVYAFHGPHSEWDSSIHAETAPTQIFGAATKDYLGRSTDAADLDGDGKAELIMGTGYHNDGDNLDAGSIYLFWGE